MLCLARMTWSERSAEAPSAAPPRLRRIGRDQFRRQGLERPAPLRQPDSWSNLYKKDGRVRQPIIMVKNGASGVDRSELRFLQVGEKVYLTDMEIKVDAIVFSLQSCGSCNPSAADPNDIPYRAELSFQFQKGYLDSANFKQIQELIGQVLAIAPREDSIGNGAPPAQTPVPLTAEGNQAAAEPTPATIELGQTTDQVVVALGQPDKVVKLGSKEIYVYNDSKIMFLNAKVSDVE